MNHHGFLFITAELPCIFGKDNGVVFRCIFLAWKKSFLIAFSRISFPLTSSHTRLKIPVYPTIYRIPREVMGTCEKVNTAELTRTWTRLNTYYLSGKYHKVMHIKASQGTFGMFAIFEPRTFQTRKCVNNVKRNQIQV